MRLDPDLLKKTGVFGLVSSELVTFIGGGYLLGAWLDKKWNTTPYLGALLALLGISYSVWRIYRLAQVWMK